MTTWAKRLGGPDRFMGTLLGTGFVVGVVVAESSHIIMRKINGDLDAKKNDTAIIYTVRLDDMGDECLSLKIGDKFRILELDGEAALIEKLGDCNNPYFVSADFLRKISDFQ